MKSVFCAIAVLALALAACNEPATTGYIGDDQNPLLKKAETERQRLNYPEAAECYEQALKLNPDSAGIHWAAATLYEQRLGDFGSAIYHYQRFKKLNPDPNQAKLVDVSIERAGRELAKLVPGVAGNTNQVAELSKRNHELEKQIEDLRQELNQVKGVAASQSEKTSPAVGEPASAALTAPPANTRRIAPAPPVAAVLSSASPPTQPIVPHTPTTAPAASGAPPTAAPVETARADAAPKLAVTGPKRTMHYAVKPGDTLTSIARRFYGDPAAAELIYRNNKTFIPNKDRLLAGTELALPPRRGR